MNTMNRVDPAGRRKSRMFLILIALIFAAPMIFAGLLTYSGWQPGAKGNGQPIVPQRNFVNEKVNVQLADGQAYAWRDSEPRMTLVALAGPDCATQCLATLTRMAAARVTLNRNQSRLRLLYLGASVHEDNSGMKNYWLLGHDIDGKLASYRPAAPDSVSALLVESNGTALSFYPAGFDPSGLRKDLQKVIK
jgi:hypothetical protein